MIRLRAIAPQFVVPDVKRAAEYYRDKLGFEIRGFWGELPVYAIVARDGVEIHLGNLVQGNVPINTASRPDGLDAYIYVEDVNGLLDDFRTRGAHLLTENVCQTEYGMKEILVKDLNGFVLAFGESSATS